MCQSKMLFLMMIFIHFMKNKLENDIHIAFVFPTHSIDMKIFANLEIYFNSVIRIVYE